MVRWLHVTGARVLDGPETSAVLYRSIAEARERVWLCQFAIDIRRDEDRFGEVAGLLAALSAAVARGVDVRVLLMAVHDTRRNPADINTAAARSLGAHGVPVRYYADTLERPALHSKLFLADTRVVAGNGNWTPTSFRVNGEMNVVVEGAQLAAAVSRKFARLWSAAISAGSAGGLRLRARTGVAAALERAGYTLLRGRIHSGTAHAAVLAGQAYVSAVTRLVTNASERVWLVMYGMKSSSIPKLASLTRAVSSGHARGVDVRILFDADPRAVDISAADVPDLLDAGIAARPWPFRSRMHARSLIVDDYVVAGSVGWTPASVMRTEALAIALRCRDAADGAAHAFGSWWEMAGLAPLDWPLERLGWPHAVLVELDRGGIRTIGDVLSADLHSAEMRV